MLGDIIDFGANLIGGHQNRKTQRKINAQQLDFSKNYVQYRVKDAQAAGIHPLAALGAPAVSPSLSAPDFSSYGDAGRAIESGLNRFKERKAQDAVFSQQQKESDARIRASDAEAALRAKQAQQIDYDMAQDAIKNKTVQAITQSPAEAVLHGPNKGKLTARGSSANDVEEEFGGLSGEVYGIYRLLDAIFDQELAPRFKKYTNPETYRKYRTQVPDLPPPRN